MILKDGERLIADKVLKFPRLKCRLKFEQNGKLLLRDDDRGKLFQSDTEGFEGPHYVELEAANEYAGDSQDRKNLE